METVTVARSRSTIYTSMLGLRDNVADGLFNPDTGELRPGFTITAEDVVIDVGCGGAIDSTFCGEQGAHVIYVDSNPDEIAIAGERLAQAGARALTPIVSDANPLPLDDGIATRVIASEVIEHVDDPQQFLRELIRVGAPDALFLLAAPDPAAEKLQAGLAAPVYFQKPNHVRIIERGEFERMVTDAGLTIERRGYYGAYWAIWWIFFWICHVDISEPHPLLQSWEKTWDLLLKMPAGDPLRRALNTLLPKSQYVVAHKTKRVGVLGRIRQLLAGTPAASAPPVLTPTGPVDRSGNDDAPVLSLSADDELDPKAIGLLDATKNGWFNRDRQEICPGFAISGDDDVLDAGYDRSNYSAICGTLGANLTVIDPDPANIAITAAGAPLPDAAFTKIVAMESIGRGSDPANFLRELVRVGRPGAQYLLGVQDAVQDLFPAREAIHTFSRDDFERMVTAAGLIVERAESTGFFWTMWFAFFAACGDPRHPLLAQWAHTWKLVLDAPEGLKVRSRLDGFMPRHQVIVARKP